MEDILIPLLKKYSIPIIGGEEHSTIIKGLSFEYNGKELNTAEDFDEIYPQILESIHYAEDLYFNKYRTIQDVFEASEKMTIQECAQFISAPVHLRRMIIKKICKDEKYEEYAQKMIEAAKELAQKDTKRYYNQDKATIELHEMLERL